MIEQAGGCITHGADERALIHLLGEHRHGLAQLNAGDIGINGLEFAADARRRIGFGIPNIDVTRSALQKYQDHRFRRIESLRTLEARCSQSFLPLEEISQVQTEQPNGPNAQQFAAGWSVTQAPFSAWNRQH